MKFDIISTNKMIRHLHSLISLHWTLCRSPRTQAFYRRQQRPIDNLVYIFSHCNSFYIVGWTKNSYQLYCLYLSQTVFGEVGGGILFLCFPSTRRSITFWFLCEGYRISPAYGHFFLIFSCHRSFIFSGMGNLRINSDFRIENFHFKHEISPLHLFT